MPNTMFRPMQRPLCMPTPSLRLRDRALRPNSFGLWTQTRSESSKLTPRWSPVSGLEAIPTCRRRAHLSTAVAQADKSYSRPKAQLARNSNSKTVAATGRVSVTAMPLPSKNNSTSYVSTSNNTKNKTNGLPPTNEKTLARTASTAKRLPKGSPPTCQIRSKLSSSKPKEKAHAIDRSSPRLRSTLYHSGRAKSFSTRLISTGRSSGLTMSEKRASI